MPSRFFGRERLIFIPQSDIIKTKIEFIITVYVKAY